MNANTTAFRDETKAIHLKLKALELILASKNEFGNGLSKAEEIELFERFVAAMPKNSYLRSILKDLPGMVTAMIKDDFGYSIRGELDRLNVERELANAEARKAEDRLTALNRGIDNATRDFNRINAAITDLRNEARKIATA